MPIDLTDDDLFALESLRHKQQHIEDAVTGLAKGLDTALFLWGEGGTGKSYTCEQRLQQLKCPYVLHNSRMTGRGLLDALQAAPSHLHWIEDAETLLGDKRALGVLRSACWSQSKKVPKVRPISWTAHRTLIRFNFTGSLLVVSNAPLLDAPEIRALRTRIRLLRMDVSPSEVLALTKKICRDGYQTGPYWLTPSECWEVAEFVAKHLAELQRPLDLRLVLLGFHDYVLARDHGAALSWQDLLRSRMAGSTTPYRSPREKSAEEKALAQTIYAKRVPQQKKVEEWKQLTGKTRASFYNALNRGA